MSWSVRQSAVAPMHYGTVIESTPCTLGSNCSANTALVAYVYLAVTSVGAVASVTDGSSNAMTQFAIATLTNGIGVSIWAMTTPAGDVGTKPVLTATSDHPGTFPGGLLVQEVSGLLTPLALDGTAGTLTGTTSGATGSPAYSTAAGGEFLVTMYGDDLANSSTITAPSSPWTEDPNSVSGLNTGGNLGVAYKNSTGGSEADGWTVSTANNWAVILAAFKVAPSSGSGLLLASFP